MAYSWFTWLPRSSQRGWRIADDYLDATVLLSAGRRIVVSNRIAATLAGCGQARCANPLCRQIRFHRLSTALGKRLVVIFTTHAVRVALDGDIAVRILVEKLGQFVQIARRARLQVGLASGEQDVAERQYQTAVSGLGVQSVNLSLQLRCLLFRVCSGQLRCGGVGARLICRCLLFSAFGARCR